MSCIHLLDAKVKQDEILFVCGGEEWNKLSVNLRATLCRVELTVLLADQTLQTTVGKRGQGKTCTGLDSRVTRA